MLRAAPAFLALLLGAGVAPAQTLAESAPADTLVYFRSSEDDPASALNRVLGGGGLWDRPVDVDVFIGVMDDALKDMGGMIGLPQANLGAWFRSIRNTEGALYRLVMADGFPDLDFALVFETPMAEEIWNLVSGRLLEDALADEAGENEIQVGIGDEFAMNIARRDDQIIIASDHRQLRETMARFGSVVPGSLAQSKRFKEALGTDTVPSHCLYVAAEPFLRMAREEIPSAGRAQMIDTVLTSLGIWKLAALGWSEEPSHSRFALVGSGPMTAFEILDCGRGGHDMLDAMPGDTVFGIAWNGDGRALWKKGSAFVLDSAKFPMAPMVEERLRVFQKTTGLKMEEIAEAAAGGLAFGFMPDKDGKIDDNPENFFAMARPGEGARAQETVEKLMTTLSERFHGEVTRTEEEGGTWYRIASEQKHREVPCAIFTDNAVVFAVDEAAHKVLASRAGRHPTLGSYDALKGLPQEASAFMFVGLKSILAEAREMGPAYTRMKDGAGVGAAIQISADRLVVQTNRSLSQVFGAVGAASSMYEAHREERRAVLADLEKIAKAYREYRAANGKDPATLSQLGFKEGDALLYPPNRAANEKGIPYKLVSTEGADPANDRQIIVVVAPDARYGRLVGTLSGDTRTMSESSYRRQMRIQAGGQ